LECVRRREPCSSPAALGLGLLALSGMTACADEPGPMSRERLEDLSRSFGDASGDTWTGTYQMRPLASECDCSKLAPGAFGLGILGDTSPELACAALVGLFVASGQPGAPFTTGSERASLLQADGFLSLTTESLNSQAVQCTGPIDADGHARVAALFGLESLSTGAQARWRYDLDLGVDDDGRRVFTGTARVLAKSNIPEQETDCRIEVEVEAREPP